MKGVCGMLTGFTRRHLLHPKAITIREEFIKGQVLIKVKMTAGVKTQHLLIRGFDLFGETGPS